MVKLPTQLNENTRLDLKVNNLWAIIISIIISAFIAGAYINTLETKIEAGNQKMDILLANQNELKQDFKSWKIQAETRLGEVEIGYNRNKDAIAYIMRFLKL